MRKIIAALLVLVMLLSLSAVALAETGITGELGANMRSAPDASSRIIRKIHRDQYLEVISRSGVWYYVSYGGQRGYVHSANVIIIGPGNTPVPGDFPVGGPFYVVNEEAIRQQYTRMGGTAVEQWGTAGIYGAKLRSEMDINNYGNEIHGVHYSEQVYVYCSFTTYFGEVWYYIKTTDGYYGYVHSGNIELAYGGYGW